MIHEADFPELRDIQTMDSRKAFLEYRLIGEMDPKTRRSPRFYSSHLHEHLMPRGLLMKKAKDKYDILFLRYEDMIKFVGKNLSDDAIDAITKRASFDNMKRDEAAFKWSDGMFKDNKSVFMRKGTTWTQKILRMIHEADFPELRDIQTMDLLKAFLEYRLIGEMDPKTRRSPRFYSSHLHEHLMPRGLLMKKAKDLRSEVVRLCQFVGKNLSDDAIDAITKRASFDNMKRDEAAYKWSNGMYKDNKSVFMRKGTTWTQKILRMIHEADFPELRDIQTMDLLKAFLEYRLIGEMDPKTRRSPRFYSSHLHEHLMPRGLLMKKAKDLRSEVVRLCQFVGKNLSDDAIDAITKRASFDNMKRDEAAYKWSNGMYKDNKSVFMRKGTTWTQKILRMIHEADFPELRDIQTMDLLKAFLEYRLIGEMDPKTRRSPRFYSSHLHEHLMPRGLLMKKAKDLRSEVVRLCQFVGKNLSDDAIDAITKRASFDNMKRDEAAYKWSNGMYKDNKSVFMRKGTIGDWKNYLTVAQSELFDRVYEEQMKDMPLKYIWDIKELKQ
ncbi:hypothetical protein NHX12_007744 [Muraenolepis orangiensis]|uniref:Sulfotransferase n=1 Tax=Muraenolepis orangiensis TaxID=630683 RepID=A0A9Q0I9Y8_9TELE|nr:hypothetical protein NHX12_007744 [Muraenolepis orangiensis]